MSPIDSARDYLRQGRMVILVDDEARENEGDLVLAAEFVTPEAINFMATHARGLICLAMAGAEIDRLALPQMVVQNNARWQSPFTISIEARHGITTGISAKDRAHTISVAANPASGPQDIVSPGHIFPLRADEDGVLRRAGHTEGSVDLMHIAGLKPAAVICEIMNEDGSMARAADLRVFAQRHDMPIVTIGALVDYFTAEMKGKTHAA